MSQENIEALRAVYEEWAKGNFGAGGDLWDERTLFIPAQTPETPETGYYLGPDDIREFMREWLKPWTKLSISAEEFVEAESSVVVRARQRGSGQESGVAVDLLQFHVWTFRGRNVTRFETFSNRSEAIEAVGLSE